MLGGTIKCPICGAPYKWFSMTVADQTACPSCVAEANRRITRPRDDETDTYRRRRARYFNQS